MTESTNEQAIAAVEEEAFQYAVQVEDVGLDPGQPRHQVGADVELAERGRGDQSWTEGSLS